MLGFTTRISAQRDVASEKNGSAGSLALPENCQGNNGKANRLPAAVLLRRTKAGSTVSRKDDVVQGYCDGKLGNATLWMVEFEALTQSPM